MNVTWLDAFGFAAFVSNVVGNIMLARLSRSGWYVRIGSILLWGAYGVTTKSLPIIANAATFFCINVYGLWSWTRDAKRTKGPVCRWHGVEWCEKCWRQT